MHSERGKKLLGKRNQKEKKKKIHQKGKRMLPKTPKKKPKTKKKNFVWEDKLFSYWGGKK